MNDHYDRTRSDIEEAIEDVRANMPWSDDRDDLLDDLYEALETANHL